MQTSLHLSIAGATVKLISRSVDLSVGGNSALHSFLGRKESPDIVLDVRRFRTPRLSPGRMIFDTNGVWRLFRNRGGKFLFVSYSLQEKTSVPSTGLSIEGEFRRGTLHLYPEFFTSLSFPLQYPLDQLLFEGYLSRGRGILIHACSAGSPAGGLLIPGVSGSGKSTISRMWNTVPGIKILSDERTACLKQGGGFMIHGTPWLGTASFASPGRSRLRAVLFLNKSRANAIRPLDPREASKKFIRCAFLPYWDRRSLDFSLGFASRLCEIVPCYELSFTPSPDSFEPVRELLAQSRNGG